MVVTAKKLLIAHLQAVDAQYGARCAEDQRNALIRRALAEGWTHARIAEATGLTRGRIGQLKLRGIGADEVLSNRKASDEPDRKAVGRGGNQEGGPRAAGIRSAR